MCCELDSMSELSGFIYIKSQVTLHVKSKAQKVYWNLILAYWKQKLLNCSYKRFHDSPIHTYVVQECCWIANSVVKILMNGFCTVMFVYFLHWHSIWRQWLEGNRKWKYIFPFEWWLMHKNAQNCYWMLIKIKKSLWNLIYAQMIVFCRWNITSRNCSSFHANECVFSHNEQQKV